MRELGEEVIIVHQGKVGQWGFEGYLLENEWIDRFAFENLLEKSDFRVDVEQRPVENSFEVILDGVSQGYAMLVAEFDTGSIEILFPVFAHTDEIFEVRDGENFNGWLHRKCDFFALEDIVAIQSSQRTSKLSSVEKILRSL